MVNRFMKKEKILNHIKELCSSVTEDTYDDIIQQSYELLESLHTMGFDKEVAYQLLLQYYNSLEESIVRDCVADLLDFIFGWCAPQKCLW